ncbi:MAG: DUF922 domain-containing protein [Pedosphaera sp.]|nr:DUF922 domain-containing protein [Pedosphaera sp.]
MVQRKGPDVSLQTKLIGASWNWLGWLVLSAFSLNAELKAIREVVRYEVSGSTGAELRAEMNRLGPVHRQSGDRHDGYTDWKISCRYDYELKPGQCRVLNFVVEMEVRITLPRWKDIAEAPAPLAANWRRYLEALQRHEDGHFELAKAVAQNLDRQMRSVGMYTTAAALRAEVDRLVDAASATCSQLQIAYDKDNNHGRNTGVRFP